MKSTATWQQLSPLCLLFALIIGIGFSSPLYAANDKLDSKKSELKQLDRKMSEIQQSVTSNQHKVEQYTQELRQTEIKLGDINKQLDSLNNNTYTTEKALDKLNKQREIKQTLLSQQTQMLAKQLRASYYLGQQSYLQLWLSPEKSANLSNTLEYYQFIYKAQLKNIQAIQATIDELTDTQKAISLEDNKLIELKKATQIELTKLRASQQQRNQAINNLKREINTKQEKLHELSAEKQNLEKIIDKLSTQKPAPTVVDFAKDKGKLSWPVTGKIIQQYGSAIDNTKLKSNGVIIGAKAGTDVDAIAPGKVIFADWLKGLWLTHDY